MVLEPSDVARMLQHVRHRRYPERDNVIILLTVRAGLRACEVAGLEWPSVLGSDKRIGHLLNVPRSIAKKGSGRQIPLHRQLKAALNQLHRAEGKPTTGAIIRSERGGRMLAGSIVSWFASLYRELELTGCSSHSGRRTFITASARILAKTGGSLRDIQELAGHRALTTTERYIQGDRHAQRRLINLL